MKKEVIYSLRMSKTIRDALKKAAKKESRSVASLLEKIIKDYLAKEGFLTHADSIGDQRWFTRREIYTPAHIFFETESKTKKIAIVIINISMGGVLIAYPKSTEIDFSAEDLPKFELCLEQMEADSPLCFNCEANRMVDSGYGVQVGANFIDTDESALQMLRSYIN